MVRGARHCLKSMQNEQAKWLASQEISHVSLQTRDGVDLEELSKEQRVIDNTSQERPLPRICDYGEDARRR